MSLAVVIATTQYENFQNMDCYNLPPSRYIVLLPFLPIPPDDNKTLSNGSRELLVKQWYKAGEQGKLCKTGLAYAWPELV